MGFGCPLLCQICVRYEPFGFARRAARLAEAFQPGADQLAQSSLRVPGSCSIKDRQREALTLDEDREVLAIHREDRVKVPASRSDHQAGVRNRELLVGVLLQNGTHAVGGLIALGYQPQLSAERTKNRPYLSRIMSQQVGRLNDNRPSRVNNAWQQGGDFQDAWTVLVSQATHRYERTGV